MQLQNITRFPSLLDSASSSSPHFSFLLYILYGLLASLGRFAFIIVEVTRFHSLPSRLQFYPTHYWYLASLRHSAPSVAALTHL